MGLIKINNLDNRIPGKHTTMKTLCKVICTPRILDTLISIPVLLIRLKERVKKSL